MYKAVIFGGTAEGRELHEFALLRGIPALTCVATEYGAEQLGGGDVRTGRLTRDEMAELLRTEKPALVIDATHPYAALVSRNVREACGNAGAEYLRVLRRSDYTGGVFGSLGEIIEKLRRTEGDAFITLGAKEARELTALPDFAGRLWLRLLPSAEGISECLALGYSARRLICMQGPFSKELNLAMFRDTGARYLVTKDSGTRGGFYEKLAAAAELNMEVFVLGRPEAEQGVSIETAMERLNAL